MCQGAPTCASGTYTLTIAFVKQGQILAERTRSITYSATTPEEPSEPEEQDTPDNDPVPVPVVPTFNVEDLIPVPEEIIPVGVPIVPVVVPVVPPPVEVIPPPAIPPTIEKAGESIVVVGSGVSLAVGVASALPSTASFTELFIFLPLRLWNILLVFLGIRKKARPWGVVYDSKTKQPLDPVYVSLIDTAGNEIASSTTIQDDMDFLCPRGLIVSLQVRQNTHSHPKDFLAYQKTLCIKTCTLEKK